MTVLVDSAALVWFLAGAPELSDEAAAAIESGESRVLVSVVTLWELAVKVGLGKLRLPYGLGEEFEGLLGDNGFEILPLSRAGLERTSRLPGHHRDPFDRLLAAEALEHSARIANANPLFDDYGVKRVW